MKMEIISDRIAHIVARFANAAPPYSSEAHIYREFGIESLKALYLLFALEEEFAISLDDQRFIQAVTIDSLARLVGETQ